VNATALAGNVTMPHNTTLLERVSQFLDDVIEK
jgi:hypothetical protein